MLSFIANEAQGTVQLRTVTLYTVFMKNTEFIRIYCAIQASIQSKSAINEKSGANSSVPKAENLSYEVKNNVVKTSEPEISNGMPEDGGSSAGKQTKSFRGHHSYL